MVNEKNIYLEKAKRASTAAASKAVNAQLKKLALDKWLMVKVKERKLVLEVDQEALDEISKLDGCYVVKTNVKESPEATSKIIHEGLLKVIPKPRLLGKRLLEALDIQLPTVVPDRGITVSPRKKLIRNPSKRHRALHKEPNSIPKNKI